MADSTKWAFDQRVKRYRNLDSGKYIARATINKMRDDFADKARAKIGGLAASLADKSLSVQAWEVAMREAIKTATGAQYVYGRGGLNIMEQADWGRAGSMTKEAYGYLRGFAEQIAAGELSEKQINARSALYLNSTVNAYERGRAASFGINLPAYPADGGTQCVPAETIVSAETIEIAYRRWYDGPMIRLEFAGSKVLSITPNHPVLTDRGWVPAGLLRQGDNVIGNGGRDGDPSFKDDPQHTPAAIGQIFGAFQGARRGRLPISPMDFHGDGSTGEVDVIWADRLLRGESNPALMQDSSDQQLTHSGDSGALACERLGEAFAIGGALATTSIIGSGSEAAALLHVESTHAEAHRLGTIARGQSRRSQACQDQATTDAVIDGDFLDTLSPREAFRDDSGQDVGAARAGLADSDHPSLIQAVTHTAPRQAGSASESSDGFPGPLATYEIIGINVAAFHGHVYNLQTSTGFYHANGIIIHNCLSNCRCRWEITETKTEIRATWVLNTSAEHCADCEARASMYSPYTITKGS